MNTTDISKTCKKSAKKPASAWFKLPKRPSEADIERYAAQREANRKRRDIWYKTYSTAKAAQARANANWLAKNKEYHDKYMSLYSKIKLRRAKGEDVTKLEESLAKLKKSHARKRSRA